MLNKIMGRIRNNHKFFRKEPACPAGVVPADEYYIMVRSMFSEKTIYGKDEKGVSMSQFRKFLDYYYYPDAGMPCNKPMSLAIGVSNHGDDLARFGDYTLCITREEVSDRDKPPFGLCMDLTNRDGKFPDPRYVLGMYTEGVFQKIIFDWSTTKFMSMGALIPSLYIMLAPGGTIYVDGTQYGGTMYSSRDEKIVQSIIKEEGVYWNMTTSELASTRKAIRESTPKNNLVFLQTVIPTMFPGHTPETVMHNGQDVLYPIPPHPRGDGGPLVYYTITKATPIAWA